MSLCSLKGAELDVKKQNYKGRVVFRGDKVKDQHDYLAVFCEQGTSASHMAASKFLSALGRKPGMSAEDADAASAYTQADL
eukprot:9152040-Karenia_brevis.AAC.1